MRRTAMRRAKPAHSLSHADRIIGAIAQNMRRGGEIREPLEEPRWRRRRRPQERSAADAHRWHSAMRGYCENPACMSEVRFTTRVQHHVCYRQHLLRLGGDEWDPANSMTLCQTCHSGHHDRGHTLLLSALPDEALAFAAALMGPQAAWAYLSRRYEGSDRRLDRMIDRVK